MKKSDKQNISKAKKIYRAVSGTISALIFVFLIIVIVLIIWQKSSGKDTSIFGYYMFDVISESMEPTIMTHDVILCKKVDANGTNPSIKKGDVITFVAPSGSLKGHNETHRIVDIKYNDDGSINYIKTAGDNKYGGGSIIVDDWNLKPSTVKAVYVRTMPVLGALRSFMMKPYGFAVVIVLPLLLAIILTIVGYVKDRTKLETEKIAAGAETAKFDVTLDNLSDEDKQKLLKDYLSAQPDDNSGETAPNNEETQKSEKPEEQHKNE